MVKNLRLTLTIISLAVCCFISCNSGRSKVSNTAKIIEDFDQFYEKFHKDSAFQMSRLKFPLQGHNEFGNKWTVDNWDIMKSKIYEVDKSQFKVEFKKTEKIFFQKVWIDGSGFSSECRFELVNGKWFLVSALEHNN
jgi:hypothetical protein